MEAVALARRLELRQASTKTVCVLEVKEEHRIPLETYFKAKLLLSFRTQTNTSNYPTT